MLPINANLERRCIRADPALSESSEEPSEETTKLSIMRILLPSALLFSTSRYAIHPR